MYDTQRRLAAWIITGLIMGAVFAWVSNQSRKRAQEPEPITIKSQHRSVMGTIAQVTAVTADVNVAQRAIEAAFVQLEKIDLLTSASDANSELSKINRDAFNEPVKVSDEMFDILRQSVYWSKRSGGEFDITAGPLADMWDAADEANAVPGGEEIAAAEAKVGYDKVLLDPNVHTVRFAVEGMRIDPGAIARGYGIDLAVEAMQKNGALGGMVEAGGDLRCFGTPPQRRKAWNIALRDPALAQEDLPGSPPIMVLAINDMAVTTSDDFAKYSAERPGEDDPNNRGSGRLSGVTILAPRATDADALAMAVSALGSQRGMALVEDVNGCEAILIGEGPNYEMMQSRNAQNFIREKKERRMQYKVKKADGPVAVDGNWNGGAWKNAEVLKVDKYMGEMPEHRPDTQAKVLYDDESLYVMFKVEDKYVRAVAAHQGNVCKDSCAEFFFVPGLDLDKGYFNVEMNCGGTMLFHFQLQPRKGATPIADADCAQMQVYHSMPQLVEPEQVGAVTWLVAYRLPFTILTKYRSAVKPAPGVVWRANFYKCADATSHPHWLTWNKVERPQPDFHVPECFGELVFE